MVSDLLLKHTVNRSCSSLRTYIITNSLVSPEPEEDFGKNIRKKFRKFAVNQRGLMGVQSMNTAKLVDEFVCSLLHRFV